MNNTLRIILCIALALAFAAMQAYAAEAGTQADNERRVQQIAEQLRCLVCQNQSIAESDADLARDLKRQVREMLAAGKSDAEITAFMVERYGDFVLYQPPVRSSTLLLWGGPALLLILAAGGFAWTLRQRRQQQSTQGFSAEDHARARALLDDEAISTTAPHDQPDQRS